jgi:hypothetical protein
MQRRDIGIYRLQSQRVTGERPKSAAEVVRHMGAIQAQDYKQAVWASGLRTDNATITDVENAIQTGEILRTWPMRGTIHFVPAEDTQWMLKLCATKVVAGHGRRMRQLELTEDIMHRCEALLVKALAGRKVITRADLLQIAEDAGISTEKQRGYHILWHLAHEGIICLGPMEGKQQTFVLLDEWVDEHRNLVGDEALSELVWRYFAGHGPATERDFARWSGLTLTETRRGLDILGKRLIHAEIDETDYWMAESTSTQPDQSVHLLAGFDEYTIGYQDRSTVVPGEHADKIVPGNNGVFRPIIVHNGQVIGTWTRKLKRKSVRHYPAPLR